MSTITQLVKHRRGEGQGFVRSLAGGIKERLKEKIDPRRIIKQDGILTALFPKLKSYNALEKTGLSKRDGKTSKFIPDGEIKNPVLKKIQENTKIFAVNSNSLPGIARDMNLMRQNAQILVELHLGHYAITRPDKFFLESAEIEKQYESRLSAEERKRSERIPATEKKKGRFGWLSLLGVVGATGAAFLVLDFFRREEESILSNMYKELNKKISFLQKNGLDYVDDLIENQFSPALSKKTKLLEETFDKFVDSFDDEFSLDNIVKKITGEKGLTEFDFTAKAAELKDQLAKSFAEFSIIPTAQAAIMPPSMLFAPDPDGVPSVSSVPSVPPVTRVPSAPGERRFSSIIDLIVAGESGRGPEAYSAINYAAGGFKLPAGKKLTDMTIGEVIKMQKTMTGSSAVGRYQILRRTLEQAVQTLGLSETDKFDERTQDRIANEFLIGTKRPSLFSFLQGTSNDINAAMMDLAKEFASMPVPHDTYRPAGSGGRTDPGGFVRRGQSYYHGLMGNRANKTVEEVQDVLLQERASRLVQITPPLARDHTISNNIMESSSELAMDEASVDEQPTKVVYSGSPGNIDSTQQQTQVVKNEFFDPLKMLIDNVA
jgi:hypothetical protein